MNCEDFTVPFGKHKDESLGDILKTDAGYLAWLYDECEIRNQELADAIEEMNEKYADEIETAQRGRRAERY